MTESCAPAWYAAGKPCPYGSLLPLGVTLPNTVMELKSITNLFLPMISLLYSFVPPLLVMISLFMVVLGGYKVCQLGDDEYS